MQYVLYILSVLSFLSGLLSSMAATTVFQQIVACISYVCAAILLIGGATVGSVKAGIENVRGDLRKYFDEWQERTPPRA